MQTRTHRKTLLVSATAASLALSATAALWPERAAQAQASAPTSIHTDAGTIRAIPDAKFFKKPGYSPFAGRNFPVRPLWGDRPSGGGACRPMRLAPSRASGSSSASPGSKCIRLGCA
jgi:hypothetical protein